MAKFQSFESAAQPEKTSERLAALHQSISNAGLDGMILPRTDAFLSEFVAPRNERLAWLTGFTGSTGLLLAIRYQKTVLFVDGRYSIQAREQTDPEAIEVVDAAPHLAADWIEARHEPGYHIGYDPWLHSMGSLKPLERAGLRLRPMEPNPIDALWKDRPSERRTRATAFPMEWAGQSSSRKRKRVAAELRRLKMDALFVASGESSNWLFNLRGQDIPHTPVAQLRALVRANGKTTLFAAPSRLPKDFDAGADVDLRPPDAWPDTLAEVEGTVLGLDPSSTPARIAAEARVTGLQIRQISDPIADMKAVKNSSELAGMRKAHLLDGAAMVEFLAWLDGMDPASLTEIGVVEKIEACRRATGKLRDIAFDTIAASGPNAALPHYRVTKASDRRLQEGEFLLVDSGGQYPFGTTDITRTIPIGEVGPDLRRAYTLVLKAMIGLERLRFPPDIRGISLDAIAREPLWRAGLDYSHGTGHGVGCHLSVHEGPYTMSQSAAGARRSLPPGIILSNEPGYYEPDRFGVRIENLEILRPARSMGGRKMHSFETLTLAPIDKRPIDASLLDDATVQWLDQYHRRVLRSIGPLVRPGARKWLERACAPLNA